MEIFPHFSIDFEKISSLSTVLSEETKGQGIVYENFTPGQGSIFRNLTPGQGSFLDFPAAPPRMFVGQVPPPPGVDTHLPYQKQPMRAAVAATKNIKKVAI